MQLKDEDVITLNQHKNACLQWSDVAMLEVFGYTDKCYMWKKGVGVGLGEGVLRYCG